MSSENPRLRFVGKGLAEMIAAELAQAKEIVLINRDRQAELLREQQFALSKAMDSAAQPSSAKIEAARSIDPNNRAVALYTCKLGGASPRFQVELDKYAPSYNPGSLGLMEAGSVYLWESLNPPWEVIETPRFEISSYRFHEMAATQRLGTLLPLE